MDQFIRDYIWNIFEIASYYNIKDMNPAFKMFITNIKLGQERYKGAKNVRYRSLNKLWNSLSPDVQNFQEVVFSKINIKIHSALMKAWNERKKRKFNEMCKVVSLKYLGINEDNYIKTR